MAALFRIYRLLLSTSTSTSTSVLSSTPLTPIPNHHHHHHHHLLVHTRRYNAGSWQPPAVEEAIEGLMAEEEALLGSDADMLEGGSGGSSEGGSFDSQDHDGGE
jgi:hypothetical protein